MSAMMVERGDSVFEINIYAADGEWEGQIIEHTMLHMVSTTHLQHRWLSQESAIAGVQRRWRRLFPDETDDSMPDISAAITIAKSPLLDPYVFFPAHP